VLLDKIIDKILCIKHFAKPCHRLRCIRLQSNNLTSDFLMPTQRQLVNFFFGNRPSHVEEKPGICKNVTKAKDFSTNDIPSSNTRQIISEK